MLESPKDGKKHRRKPNRLSDAEIIVILIHFHSGKDKWYMVYHRINKNYIHHQPGVHREVCIDKMEFNEDGTIKPVIPTHEGVRRVK